MTQSLIIRLYIQDLEAIMLRALTTGLLIGAVVFMAAVIWGWWYALLLAFMILIGINLIEMVKR